MRASQIPFPGTFTQGFSQGSSMIDSLFKSLLQQAQTRASMKNNYERMMMEKQFMPYRIAQSQAYTNQANLNQQMAPIRAAFYEAQAKKANFDADPNALISKYKALVSGLPASEQDAALYSLISGKAPTSTADTISSKINQQEQITQSKQDIKDASTIRDSSLKLAKYWDIVNNAEKLLKENPGLTGLEQGGLNKLNLNKNPKLQALNQNFLDIAGLKSSELATRPGFGTLSIVGQVKPSILKPVEANLGGIQEIKRNLRNIFNLYNTYYKDTMGKDLPFLPPQEDAEQIAQQVVKNPGVIQNGSITVRNRKTGMPEKLTLDQAKAMGIL